MRQTAYAALVGAVLIGGPAAAQTSWDMPTPYPDPNFHTQNIKAFAEDVREATGGQLTINIHPAGSLFQHPEIKDAVRRGLVPIGEVLISRLANEDPVFEVDSVPFLASSYEEAEKLAEAARPVLEEKLQAQGLRLLYTVPWPPQGLYTRQAVNGVEDLNGLRFRAYNAATEVEVEASQRLVELMRTVYAPDTLPGRPRGEGYGLSVRVVNDPVARNTFLSEGSFGWSGAYGTHFWVDRKEKLVAVVMTQTSNQEFLRDFENMVMQAVVGGGSSAAVATN